MKKLLVIAMVLGSMSAFAADEAPEAACVSSKEVKSTFVKAFFGSDSACEKLKKWNREENWCEDVEQSTKTKIDAALDYFICD